MRSDTAAGYTVADLARRWRVSEDKIRAWIRAGDLAAINTSGVRCRRPRFVVTPENVTAFERRLTMSPSPPKRKRKKKTVEVDFYPD